MNNVRNNILYVLSAFAFGSVLAKQNNVATLLIDRPVARDNAFLIAGTSDFHRHISGMEGNYGYGVIGFEYQQSWRNKDITEKLFGPALVSNTATTTTNNDDDNDSSIVNISGSSFNTTRGSADLLADHFYLPTDFKSSIAFSPRIRKFAVKFGFHMTFEEWVNGLFIDVYAPFVHTRHELRFTEASPTKGVNPYAAGTFDSEVVPATALLGSFAEYAKGSSITAPNVKTNGLAFAKITDERHTQNEFGELHAALGYNFMMHEDYHFGISLQLAAPTGKRPNAEYLFDAHGTNLKNWELGGGITGHYTFWRSEDDEKRFDFCVEADMNHLFKAKHHRTFDLKGKPLSRYMLAEKMQANAAGATQVVGASGTPSHQFAAEYAPVANFSTLEVKSSFGVQADVAAMFSFIMKGWSFNLGYEFFGGSKEHIHVDLDEDNSLLFAEKTWALKGLASVYGYTNNADLTTSTALSATNSTATIFGSSVNATNVGIDNATPATTPTLANLLAFGNTQINTSVQPVFISLSDLDIEGAEIKIQSHKLFFHANYTWMDREDWTPFIGFGAHVEFGGRTHSDDDNASSSAIVATKTINTAASKWGISLKGGLSFN